MGMKYETRDGKKTAFTKGGIHDKPSEQDQSFTESKNPGWPWAKDGKPKRSDTASAPRGSARSKPSRSKERSR